MENVLCVLSPAATLHLSHLPYSFSALLYCWQYCNSNSFYSESVYFDCIFSDLWLVFAPLLPSLMSQKWCGSDERRTEAWRQSAAWSGLNFTILHKVQPRHWNTHSSLQSWQQFQCVCLSYSHFRITSHTHMQCPHKQYLNAFTHATEKSFAQMQYWTLLYIQIKCCLTHTSEMVSHSI